jgi:hypothetical protein
MEEVEAALRTEQSSGSVSGALRVTTAMDIFGDRCYLRAGGQSDHEVQREEARHEDLTVLADHRILITQCRDDGFRAAELCNKLACHKVHR